MKMVIEGLDAFRSDIERGRNNIAPLVQRTMAKAVNAVKDTAQERVAFDTGTQRRSIMTKIENGGLTGVVFQDQNQAKYGPYIEYGTQPHVIQVISKKVLASRRQNIIFGTIVNHPGSKARPFMAPAFDENVDRIRQMFSEMLEEIVRMMAGK